MWVDLIKAGVVKEKLDGQPNRILLELWHQLKPEQQFQPLRSRTRKLEAKPMSGLCPCKTSWETVLRIHLSPHPHRRMIGHQRLTEVGVKAPTVEDVVGTRGHM